MCCMARRRVTGSFFFSSRRRHTRLQGDWSSDVCSSDLNWVEGESLAEALRRGPRPIRTAHALVRDLLGAAEHAHARGVILRRIVPLTLMLELTGRAVITDLRYCNWCLPNVPPEEQGAGGAF